MLRSILTLISRSASGITPFCTFAIHRSISFSRQIVCIWTLSTTALIIWNIVNDKCNKALVKFHECRGLCPVEYKIRVPVTAIPPQTGVSARACGTRRGRAATFVRRPLQISRSDARPGRPDRTQSTVATDPYRVPRARWKGSKVVRRAPAWPAHRRPLGQYLLALPLTA